MTVSQSVTGGGGKMVAELNITDARAIYMAQGFSHYCDINISYRSTSKPPVHSAIHASILFAHLLLASWGAVCGGEGGEGFEAHPNLQQTYYGHNVS